MTAGGVDVAGSVMPLRDVKLLGVTLDPAVMYAVLFLGVIQLVIFMVKCGVRQGGVLSPYLFVLYMDELINQLRHSSYGLHIQLFVGCAFNALMSALCYGIQPTNHFWWS